MEQNKKTPQVRFKGYNDNWEQRKLGDIFKEYSEKGYPELPALTIIQGGGTIRRDASDRNLQYDEASLVNYKMVNEGDFIVHLRSFEGGLEKATISGIISPAYHTFHGEDTDSRFYYSYFRSPKFIDQDLKPHVYGIRDGRSIDIGGMKTIEIPWTSIKEQRAIGDYIDCLDNLIALHQRKYDKLINVKKAMLEKLFPKNGSLYPAIRFEGFTDAWKQRKLLDCIEKITDFRGRTPKKLGMDWSESGCLALSALNVKDGYIDFTQNVHYGSQELYDRWMTGSELHKGQVLFTTEAPMGNVAQVPDNRRYILSQRTIAFDVKPDLITENFLATVLRSPVVFTTLTALSSGGTAKGVSQKSLSTVYITIPNNLGEQERLSSIFLELDHLITLHQRKLEKLKNIKKSCLEKMFI